MKSFLSFLLMLLVSFTLSAQDISAAGGHLEASFQESSGISYKTIGEIPKDGIAVIDLKMSALAEYQKQNFSLESAEAITREKESLEQLRQRILIQRERLMKPMPSMQEIAPEKK
jgi:hypothetical protein